MNSLKKKTIVQCSKSLNCDKKLRFLYTILKWSGKKLLTQTKIEIHIITETTLNKITVCAINYVYFWEAETNIFSRPNVKSHLIKEI